MNSEKHQYSDLASEISREFNKLCGKNPCHECRYCSEINCRILFVLDYLDNKKINKQINEINKITTKNIDKNNNELNPVLYNIVQEKLNELQYMIYYDQILKNQSNNFIIDYELEEEFSHLEISKAQDLFLNGAKKYLKINCPNEYIVFKDHCVHICDLDFASKNIKNYERYIC